MDVPVSLNVTLSSQLLLVIIRGVSGRRGCKQPARDHADVWGGPASPRLHVLQGVFSISGVLKVCDPLAGNFTERWPFDKVIICGEARVTFGATGPVM